MPGQREKAVPLGFCGTPGNEHKSSASDGSAWQGTRSVLTDQTGDFNPSTKCRVLSKFAPLLTEELRHREPRRGSRWFLDEVCIEIGGKKLWLWRAVDDSGAVLDLLLQDRQDSQAAKTFFGKLLANYDVPDVIHTYKLWSYGAAIRALPVIHSVDHVQVISTARCNNLIEQSHRPTRQQERSQIGFKNQRRAQEFLALHARVSNL